MIFIMRKSSANIRTTAKEATHERIVEVALDDTDKAGFQKSVDSVHGLMASAKTLAPELA